MKRKCILCGDRKEDNEFGSQPRLKHGRDPRCKLCIAEHVKRTIRLNRSWPWFINQVGTWPLQKIESEIQWLTMKLNRLKQERKIRGEPCA